MNTSVNTNASNASNNTLVPSQASGMVDIITYVTNQTKAPNGLELIPVHFKTDSETKIKPESKAVSVVAITDAEIQENLASLITSIKGLILEARKDILRDAVLDGKSFISNDDLSINGVIKFLSAVNAGTRIDKNMLADWFDNIASSVLSVVIAEKLGINNDTLETSPLYVKLAETLETYKGYFVKLSSGKTNYSVETANALERALSFIVAVDANDKITNHLVAKVKAMKEKPKADLLAL